MFKPSLKRSKLQEIQLYTKTYEPPHTDHQTLKALTQHAVRNSSFDVEDNIIFPTSFFHETAPISTDPIVFNPLNYEWNEYPSEVRKEIDSEMEVDGITSMGCHKQLVWYYQSNILHLWQRTQQKVYKYKMHAETTCMEIGEIESSCLHFKTRNLYIVAVGVANMFFLFGIDKQTFAMSDLKFNYQLINSRYIQTIKFVRENQIVVASDTSHFCHFDFTNQTRIATNRLPILQRALPFIPLLYPSSNNYIQQILVAQDNIYVLIREEKPVNWLTLKAKAAMNLLTMSNEEIRETTQRKRIEVYAVNRKDNTIELLQKITEEDFIRKLKSKHPQACENKEAQGLKIASIYLTKGNCPGRLSIATKCGYFITINQTQDLILASTLLKAPQENSIGVVGLFLQKRQIEEESYSKENRVSQSLGVESLTLMNNALWYLSEDALETLKCDRAEGGDILTIKEGSQRDEWLVFTKAGYYRVARLKVEEVFISYMLVRNELTLKSPEKSWSDEANFELFVQNLAKIIGYEKICESIIGMLLHEGTEFKVAQPILQMINDQLRGHSNKNYRDWSYSLCRNISTASLKITEKVEGDLWKCLIELQSKSPKGEAEKFVAQSIYCNAYWYALRNLFVKYTSPLLKVETRTIKLNISKIQDSIKLLETLNKFFFLKGEKELRYLSEAMVNRNNNYKKEKSLPKSPISKLKPMNISEKKEEEANESTVDQTTLAHQKKYINESSTKLEAIITKSIKKIKTLITIFLYLADLNETEQLGNIQQIFSSRKERRMVRKHLQARVEDTQRLEEFSKMLPELELDKALEFNKWYQYQQKTKKPQMANLAEIAKFICSEDLQKLKSIFESRFDSLTDLLLLYWDRLFSEMATINRKEHLQSKHREIFAGQRGFVDNENKDYICDEMKVVESEVKGIIGKAIKAYINSTHEDYPKSEKMINNVIRIITSHDDKNLISYAENEMANCGLAEKLILLRKWKKKEETLTNATEILNRRKFADKKRPVEREYLSNYEIYLLEGEK